MTQITNLFRLFILTGCFFQWLSHFSYFRFILTGRVWFRHLNWFPAMLFWGFPSGSAVKKVCLQCRRRRRSGFNPWARKIPWRRAWQPIPVFLPGESMDRGAWRTTVQRVTKSRTWLSDWAYTCTHNTLLLTYYQQRLFISPPRLNSFSSQINWDFYLLKEAFHGIPRGICLTSYS